jgi:hypothetical protein
VSLTFQQAIISTIRPVTGAGGFGGLRYGILPSLPSGLLYNTSTGVISGTPTVVSSSTSYVVTVSDTLNQSVTQSFNLVVAYPAIITTQARPFLTLVKNVSTSSNVIPVTAVGGVGTLSWSLNQSLPAGLIFTTATGAINGTPTVTLATTTYVVTVSDTVGTTSTNTFSLFVDVEPPPPPLVLSVLTPDVLLEQYVRANAFNPINATGGKGLLSYTISPQLPGNLLYTTSTGQIIGVSTGTLESTQFTVTVTDQFDPPQVETASFNITVDLPDPIELTVVVGNIQLILNVPTDFTPILASGGIPPLRFETDAPVALGLTYNSVTGQVIGTPREIGRASCRERVLVRV